MSETPTTSEEKKFDGDGDSLVTLPQLPSRSCTVLAHNKIVLHALKYLSNSVLGVLIGMKYRGDNNIPNIHVLDAIPILHNSFSAMVIEIAFLQLETWLSQVNKNKKSQGKLEIVGVYFANEDVEDSKKSTSAILIASQLVKQTSKSSVLLCQVDNERIEGTYKGNDTCLDWYTLGSNGNAENDRDWKEIDIFSYTTSKYCNTWAKDAKNGTLSAAKSVVSKQDVAQYEEFLLRTEALTVIKDNNTGLEGLIKQGKELLLSDFEDHLDAPRKDWRNIF